MDEFLAGIITGLALSFGAYFGLEVYRLRRQINFLIHPKARD